MGRGGGGRGGELSASLFVSRFPLCLCSLCCSPFSLRFSLCLYVLYDMFLSLFSLFFIISHLFSFLYFLFSLMSLFLSHVSLPVIPFSLFVFSLFLCVFQLFPSFSLYFYICYGVSLLFISSSLFFCLFPFLRHTNRRNFHLPRYENVQTQFVL